MTQRSVLIAALSGRALTAAARRAGYVPLVVDAFGDEDTADTAGAFQCLPDATRTGFRARPLLAALAAVESKFGSPPIGLILGSGFEDTPKLVEALSHRHQLLGNGSRQVKESKDPATFFPLLDELGIAHPETRLEPPPSPEGWLSKRIGGSGGNHIMRCGTKAAVGRGRYFQRAVPGEPVSVLAVVGKDSFNVAGISRQWSTGHGARPYRYGGAAGPTALTPDIETSLTSTVGTVSRALALRGLVAFDFVVAESGPLLLEVNPRPSATLDIFDDANGSLFEAHVAASRGEPITLRQPLPQGGHAAAILYADHGPLLVNQITWPDWTGDRPRAGTRIPKSRPIATVFARDASATGAERICRRRLDELAQMLYGRPPGKERTNATTNRARPERIIASSETR